MKEHEPKSQQTHIWTWSEFSNQIFYPTYYILNSYFGYLEEDLHTPETVIEEN